MRWFPLVLLALLGAAVLAFLLLGQFGEESAWDPAPADPSAPGTPAPLLTGRAPPPAGESPVEGEDILPRGKTLPIDPRTAPRGDLHIRLVDAAGEPIDTNDVRLDLDWIGRVGQPAPLARRNIETRVWSFIQVPTGPVRVRVRGAYVLDVAIDTVVQVEAQPVLDVRVRPGGAVRFEVANSMGEPPESISIEVLDTQLQVVEAWYESSANHRVGTVHRARRAQVGHAGRIFGLAPGRYRIEVESAAGGRADETIDVEPGRLVEAKLLVAQ